MDAGGTVWITRARPGAEATARRVEALGFKAEHFTCVFAAGRTAGWIAHAREQALGGRLIRPASIYIGPSPSRPTAHLAASATAASGS